MKNHVCRELLQCRGPWAGAPSSGLCSREEEEDLSPRKRKRCELLGCKAMPKPHRLGEAGPSISTWASPPGRHLQKSVGAYGGTPPKGAVATLPLPTVGLYSPCSPHPACPSWAWGTAQAASVLQHGQSCPTAPSALNTPLNMLLLNLLFNNISFHYNIELSIVI